MIHTMEALKKIEAQELQTKPIIIPSDYTISKIIGVLKDLNVYEVFTVERNKIGMITIRDILKVSHLASAKPSSLINHPTKITPTTALSKIARILTDYSLRALPIVKDEEFTGAVKDKKILEVLLAKSDLNFPIKSLSSSKLITITEDDIVAKARNLMVENRVDHLPVISHKKISGILTSSHIIFRLIPRERSARAFGIEIKKRLSYQVKALMDNRPLLCQAHDKAFSVLEKMLKMDERYALITVLDIVQGIITMRDFVRLLAEPEVKPEIPVYIIGLPEDPFEAALAESKFFKVVQSLKRVFPDIEEARSVIKISESIKGKERRRYEVDIAIKVTKDVVSFSHKGWELPSIYDELSNRIKRLLSQRRRKTRRKRTR
jgi:CBS domain-containing protein